MGSILFCCNIQLSEGISFVKGKRIWPLRLLAPDCLLVVEECVDLDALTHVNCSTSLSLGREHKFFFDLSPA